MPGEAVVLGPFKQGMNNASGTGEFIEDEEVFELVNLEVDTDGALVNRPAVVELSYATAGSKVGVRVLGSYLPADGRRYLVIQNAGSLKLIDLATDTYVATSNTGLADACVAQYDNRLWVIPGPQDTAGNGGYFEAISLATPTWTTAAAIPRGGSVFLYKERIWVAAGIASTTNTTRLSFSDLGDPTTWPGINFFNVEPGNGEKLVDGLVLNNDIVLFKQHSSYRFTYDSDPAKGTLSKINNNIGVPAANCAVTYDNSNVYVLHDNSVYELFNMTYTRISDNIAMTQESDLTLYAADNYGLSLYRDRLFVRYYRHMYVYSLRTGTWSRWLTDRKFGRLVTISTTDIGLDIAYSASATTDLEGKIFYFRDSRIMDVGTGEVFTCDVTTKTYEFDKPEAFKRMFWWGLTIATSGTTTATAVIPNAGKNPTWDEWELLTWDDLVGVPWGVAADVEIVSVYAPAKGGYARKFYKLNKGYRFIRTFFRISTEAKPNSISDSAVRIFKLTGIVSLSQPAVEKVS